MDKSGLMDKKSKNLKISLDPEEEEDEKGVASLFAKFINQKLSTSKSKMAEVE